MIARHEVSSSLIYTWRKQLRVGKLAGAAASQPVFAEVRLAEPVVPASPPVPFASGRIDIALPGGVRSASTAGWMQMRWHGCCRCCGESGAVADAGVSGVRRDRHAQGVRRPGGAGAAGAGGKPAFGRAVRVSGQARASGQAALVRRAGLCLFSKRLDRGRFVWPVTASGTVVLTTGAIVDADGGHRLASPRADVHADAGGLKPAVLRRFCSPEVLRSASKSGCRKRPFPLLMPPARIAALEALLARANAALAARDLLIDSLRGQIARLRRMQFGASSEKLGREIEQLELALERAGSRARRGAGRGAPVGNRVAAGTGPQPAGAPAARRGCPRTASGACTCPDCGGALRRLGMDAHEMLDVVPVRWRWSATSAQI